MEGVGWGFQRLQGVRDQLRCLGRYGLPQNKCSFLEQNMEDMFWKIPKNEVFKSITWACNTLRKRHTTLFFALAKGGLKHLDRLGKASASAYFVLDEEQLLRYVKFDVMYNNLFCLGPLILQQGSNGVPIGGFISAQIAEIWAMWREYYFTQPLGTHTTAIVTHEMKHYW